MGTPRDRPRCLAAAVLAATAILALAACATTERSAPVEQPVAGAVLRGSLREPITGRWMLAAPGISQCAMTFGTSAGGSDGTIAPEGGCPGNFYTSRKWSFEQDALVIRDHNGQPLGRLALSAPGRFDGTALNGQPLTLTR